MNNDQKVRILLENLAEDISTDTNLWPVIRQDIRVKRRFDVFRDFSTLRRVAVVMVAMLIFVGTALAIYGVLGGFYGDPGIQQVEDLLTPLDLRETHPEFDVNVSLLWAYADGHRITVSYIADFASDLIIPNGVQGILSDADGRTYLPAEFLGVGGGGGGGGNAERNSFGSTLSFDARAIDGNPQTLSLDLTLQFQNPPTMDGSGSGSGGGGGGGNSTPAGSTSITHVEPFEVTFDFDVPFIPARRSEETMTRSIGNITMTVSELSYAPSITIGHLCYTFPGDEREWHPALYIEAGEALRQIGSFTVENVDNQTNTICGTLSLFEVTVDNARNPGEVAFSIPYLQSEAPDTTERTDELVAAMEKRGFGVIINNGQISIESIPDDLQSEDYYPVFRAIMERILWDRIEGPWDFRFRLR
ncbi:hypothetical protein HC928_03485 [bacterium]|nr:hypothetical protein [bacterium]